MLPNKIAVGGKPIDTRFYQICEVRLYCHLLQPFLKYALASTFIIDGM
jgi:hypothetical protein